MKQTFDFSSDIKENDNFIFTFKYHVSSVKQHKVSAVTQNSQEKWECNWSLKNSILNKTAKIMKKQIKKEKDYATLKIIHSDEW